MESEMDAEMRFHVEAYAEDLVRGGMGKQEALRRARVEFGGVEQKKEECRDARGVTLVENFTQDVRFGARMLRNNPGFTAVAVLTLALGIGANAAIFTVISAVLLRPLAVEHPEQLVAVGDPTRVHAWSNGTPGTKSFSYPLYREVRAQNEVFSSLLAASRLDNARIVIDKGTEELQGRVVSENYFETLGVEALIGRTFGGADGGAPGTDPIAVISYSYWQKRFAGSPAVLGRTVRLNDRPMTIIGVTGPKFSGEVVEDQPDIWVPMMMEPQLMPHKSYLENANISALLLVGRLKPGTTIRQAKANLDGLVKRALTGPLDAKLSADDRDAVRNMKVDVQVSAGGRGALRGEGRVRRTTVAADGYGGLGPVGGVHQRGKPVAGALGGEAERDGGAAGDRGRSRPRHPAVADGVAAAGGTGGSAWPAAGEVGSRGPGAHGRGWQRSAEPAGARLAGAGVHGGSLPGSGDSVWTGASAAVCESGHGVARRRSKFRFANEGRDRADAARSANRHGRVCADGRGPAGAQLVEAPGSGPRIQPRQAAAGTR
jgi:hypothetical protein